MVLGWQDADGILSGRCWSWQIPTVANLLPLEEAALLTTSSPHPPQKCWTTESLASAKSDSGLGIFGFRFPASSIISPSPIPIHYPIPWSQVLWWDQVVTHLPDERVGADHRRRGAEEINSPTAIFVYKIYLLDLHLTHLWKKLGYNMMLFAMF